jgi:hypothetical protein
MPEYRVRWEIDVEAESPREAAEKALATQRDPESEATVFDVSEKQWRGDGYDLGPVETYDLLDDPDQQPLDPNDVLGPRRFPG